MDLASLELADTLLLLSGWPCGETGGNPELAATPGDWTEDWSGFICLQSPSDDCREPGSSMLDWVTALLPSTGSPELLACSLVCLHLNFLWAGGKLLPCESADPGDKLGVVELKGLVDHEVGISADAELDTVEVTV